ncbi:hypothetical protein ACS0TY_026718 [Phlomoides rotata]
MLQDPLISSKFECHIFVRMGLPHEWEETVRAIAAQLDPHEMLKPGNEDLQDYLCKTFEVKKSLIVLDDMKKKVGIFFVERYLVKRGALMNLRAGKKIAENCEGLPLLILTVASLYPTPEHWIEIAANKTNSIFVDAYEQVSEALYPSYDNFTQNQKTCFPQNCDVRLSKFINNCGVWRDFLVSLHTKIYEEARNEKFLQVLNSYTDASVQGIKSQRRLSIYKNILFSIKDLFVHSYVPICLDLRLLKILDALTIRFYEFPLDVLKLIHLKYLSLTCNGNLPPSISEMWNLQCLILSQHLIIKSSASQSYLPVEIWELQELEYLQIMGRNLPDPPPGAVLRNLMILLDVGAHTCTKRVVKSIPNLRKLRVHDIESWEFDAAPPPSFYDDISHLRELRDEVSSAEMKSHLQS